MKIVKTDYCEELDFRLSGEHNGRAAFCRWNEHEGALEYKIDIYSIPLFGENEDLGEEISFANESFDVPIKVISPICTLTVASDCYFQRLYDLIVPPSPLHALQLRVICLDGQVLYSKPIVVFLASE